MQSPLDFVLAAPQNPLSFTSVLVSPASECGQPLYKPHKPAAQEEEVSRARGLVAVRPSLDRVYGTYTVQAVTPARARITLLKLRVPRPEWARRYWLAEPVDLPAGSRIEVTTTPPPSFIDLSGARFMKTYPLEAVLDYVAR